MKSYPNLWFALDVDEGVTATYRTKAEAIADICPRGDFTVEVHRYGPGAYRVQWHYIGHPVTGFEFFLERGTSHNIDTGGWDWAIEKWEASRDHT